MGGAKKTRRARRSAQVRVCIACSKFGSVRAARALQGGLIDFYPSACARKFSVSRAWSCVVRRTPFGILNTNLTRVASLFCTEERLCEARFLQLSWKFPGHMIMGAHFVAKDVALPHQSHVYAACTLIKYISPFFPGSFCNFR